MGGYAYFGARMFAIDGALWRTDGSPQEPPTWASRNGLGSIPARMSVLLRRSTGMSTSSRRPRRMEDRAVEVGRYWRRDDAGFDYPLTVLSSPVVSNGYLYFVATTATATESIAQMERLRARALVVPASPDTSGPYQPVVAGNYVFYVTYSTSNVCTVYSADQTTGQRTALAEVGNTIPPSWAPLGNKVIFQGKSTGTGIEPWVTDGTPRVPICSLTPFKVAPTARR